MPASCLSRVSRVRRMIPSHLPTAFGGVVQSRIHGDVSNRCAALVTRTAAPDVSETDPHPGFRPNMQKRRGANSHRDPRPRPVSPPGPFWRKIWQMKDARCALLTSRVARRSRVVEARAPYPTDSRPRPPLHPPGAHRLAASPSTSRRPPSVSASPPRPRPALETSTTDAAPPEQPRRRRPRRRRPRRRARTHPRRRHRPFQRPR